MRRIVFCDFDGTIATHDTLDAIQDIYGPSDWRERYGEMRRSGTSARDTIRKTLESCNATLEQITQLISTIEIRAGFEEFLTFVRTQGYEFTIQSEGIDLGIKIVLHQRGLDDIPYFTNRFVINDEGRPSTVNIHTHPDCPVCGNCKASHLIEARKSGAAIVYIGDGTTDRCPAQLADVVFARAELAEWCRAEGVPFIQFEDFNDVLREFQAEDFESRLEAESRKDVERKLILPSRDFFRKDETFESARFSLECESP